MCRIRVGVRALPWDQSSVSIKKVRFGITVRRRTSTNDDKYLLCEAELAYKAGFDAETGALSKCWCGSHE